jgi:hypothetical protein
MRNRIPYCLHLGDDGDKDTVFSSVSDGRLCYWSLAWTVFAVQLLGLRLGATTWCNNLVQLLTLTKLPRQVK